MKTGIQYLSVVISFRNEEGVLAELIQRLRQTLDPLFLRYEIIFVNDASTDNSLSVLQTHAKDDHRIRIITMSRAFGHAEGVFAGMEASSGDAVVYMDADLQDPPELIPSLMETMEKQEADVVYTTRIARKGEHPLKMALTRLVYRVLRFVSTDIVLPLDAGDFKLLSRRALDHLLGLPENRMFLRGLVTWVGFHQVGVEYVREKRFAGKSKFPVFQSANPVNSFFQALVSFSMIPVYLVFASGPVFLVASFIYAILKMIQGTGSDEFAILVFLLLFASGAVLTGVGLVGIYAAFILYEVKKRPRYIIKETMNLKKIQPPFS